MTYLDGSLANQMLQVFLTEDISASYNPSSLHLDLEFDLDSYLEVAYQLSMYPSTPAITTTSEYDQDHCKNLYISVHITIYAFPRMQLCIQ